MPDLHSLPPGTHPAHAIRNNGPDDLVLERFKLRELAEGWPMYRDSREWENFRSIFHHGAFVYTTWTGRISVEDFIVVSQKGMDDGANIMHRVHGSSVDIAGIRAVVKMKATITQRFELPPDSIFVDAESDCRFCMFFEKDSEGKWGARFVRHFYEKDKLIPVDPRRVPAIDDKKLEIFPVGYRYLAYCQEECMPGIKVKRDMPGIRGEEHDKLLQQVKAWLDGEEIQI
ncbi:putative pathogenesis associated protein Pep2 [Mycena pura]|uniref:Pathogenesis associated protein Pep2 n=1 Tax=Mycena pura TaxID=153505 RepID=A0AAD6VFA5_9AGAR|nr:putative pathogenesis associated protein Pep2 [Mycena pura]